MKNSSELIVLGSTPIKDKTVVIHCLSEKYGRRGFIVHPGKGAALSLLLPLSILEADIFENPKSQLWSASALSSKANLLGIRNNVHKNAMTLFMSEVLYRTVRESGPDEGLFNWCKRSILTFNALEGNFSNYHIRFLLELADQLGFSPSVEGLLPFAGEDFQTMVTFIEGSLAECLLVPLNGEKRNILCDKILRYIEHHSDSRLEVKSLSVLRQLYD